MNDARARPAIELVVGTATDGARLDRFLRDRFPGTSLSLVGRMLDSGGVRVNDRPARKGDRVRIGDRVSVAAKPAPADWRPAPDGSVALRFAYEDDAVAVVAKPAGVPTVPLLPDERGTVAGALLALRPDLAGIGRTPRDCGLISRLDRGTSGLLVAALTPRAFDALIASSSAGRITKRYLAVVEGVRTTPWPPYVRRRLRALGPRGAVVVAGSASEAPQTPETRILRARAGYGATLVVVEVRKGARRQIRAHLAALGHPIAGDVERGGRALPDGTLALHAAAVEFPHPTTGAMIRVEAPPMEPLASVLREARLAARRRDTP